MNNRPNPDQIAEEAVGQRHDSPPPHAVKEKEDMSPEDAVRQIARSAGADASTSEKTAESVGERVGDAYSDPESGIQTQTKKFDLHGATTAQAIRFSRPAVRSLNSYQIASMNNHLRWRSPASPSAMRPQSCFTGEPMRMSGRRRVRFKLRDLHGARDIRKHSSSQLSSKP